MARATYYYHLNQTEKPDKYEEVKRRIHMIFEENKGRIGHRRITIVLQAEHYKINKKTVLKIMRQLGLFCKVRMSKYHSYHGEVGMIAPDLLEQNFAAASPNQKWVTDVTEFNIRGDRLYLSPIMDLFNGEIIAFQTHRRPMYELVKNMLKDALTKLADHEKPIIHSDQGWQYQHQSYQQRLKNKGIKQSMSRKGNSMDNGMMENFFGLLKTEMFYDQEDKYKTLDELIIAIDDYINYYNYDRIKVKLKGLSPVNYRLQSSN